GARVGGELTLRPFARLFRAAADGLEVAELAVGGGEGMRKHPGREQVEELSEDLACLPTVEQGDHPLTLPLAAGKEVSGLGDLAGSADAVEQGLEGHCIERRLDLPAAPHAHSFPDAQVTPGLVVPDLEGAVGRLVHPVDRAAQTEGPA